MKAAALPLAVALTAAASATALAQAGSDLVGKLQACSQLEGNARRDCLDKLSREIAPPPSVAAATAPAPAPAGASAPATAIAPAAPPATAAVPVADTWFVTETVSPLDYSPIAMATATAAAGPDGATMSLSVQCRSGRTDIVVAGAAVQRAPEEATVTYSVNAGPPIPVAIGTAPSGNGLAFRVDVVRLIASLPEEGDLAIRVGGRQGGTTEGRFSLAGLKAARTKIAATCKWPASGGAPRN